MLTKLIGYIIIGLSLVGIVFFRNYAGHSISYPTLWYSGCIILCLLGIYLSNDSFITKKQKKDNDESLQQQERLKLSGERIMLDINSCTFKTNNFEEEIKSKDDIGIQMYDALYSPNRNHNVDEINQTVIVYDYKIGDQIKTADKKGIAHVLIIGENELKAGQFTVKNLQSGEETKGTIADIAKALLK